MKLFRMDTHDPQAALEFFAENYIYDPEEKLFYYCEEHYKKAKDLD